MKQLYRCEQCKKISYPNSGAADKSRRAQAGKRFQMWEMDIYECRHGNGWHLGHVNRREMNKRIKLDKTLGGQHA